MTPFDANAGELLKDACDQVINDPDLAPEIGPDGHVTVTHCNAGALLVAQALSCHEFDTDGEPLMADEMIALMERNESGKWSTGTGSEATIHALSGGLGFAAKTSAELGEAHGHIAAIAPLGMQAGHWGEVPMVANCGKQNGEERVSQAFPISRGEPTYFLWNKES